MLFSVIFLKLFQSQCSQALMRRTLVTGSKLMRSSLQLEKTSFAIWQRRTTEPPKYRPSSPCSLKSVSLKSESWYQPHAEEEEVRGTVGYFQKYDTSTTNMHFAFQNQLRCHASWPVVHEKRSHAFPALVSHAERAEKWQLVMGRPAQSPSQHRLFCTSKIPWEMEPREEQSSLPLQRGNWQERRGEPGHEWCLGAARAAGRN